MGNKGLGDKSEIVLSIGFPVATVKKHMDWPRAVALGDINVEKVGFALAELNVKAAFIFGFGFVGSDNLCGFAVCCIRKPSAIIIFNIE
jgi:hypothetical protein